jgi:hypothetical protein
MPSQPHPDSPSLRRVRALPSVDAEYRFGRPKLYLAAHELARLTILRSRLGDTPAERAREADSPTD